METRNGTSYEMSPKIEPAQSLALHNPEGTEGMPFCEREREGKLSEVVGGKGGGVTEAMRREGESIC